MNRRMLGVPLVVLAMSCTPHVRTTMIGAAAAPEVDARDVLVFSVRVPDCPFEEIAIVSATKGDFQPPDMDALLRSLRDRARQLGGHALVGVTERPRTEVEGPSLVGTVVRFTSPECRPRRGESD
jgi:hypothetical protein